MELSRNATHRHAQDVTDGEGRRHPTVAAVAAFVVAGVRALHMKMRDEAWQRDIDRLFGRD